MTVNEVTGIAGLSRDAFINRMKDQYLPKWEDAVNEKTVAWNLLGKKAGSIIGGRRSLTSIMFNYSQSAGIGLFEDDDLPTPRAPSYAQLEIFPRAIYARVRVTGHVERAARAGNSAVFAKPVKEQLRSARSTHTMNKNRMMYLGPYQILGTVAAYDDSDMTLTMYSENSRNAGSNNRYKFGAQYFREFQSIAIVPRTGGSDIDPGGDPDDSNLVAANERYIASIDDSGAQPVLTLNDSLPTDIEATGDNALVIPWRGRVDSVDAENTASHDSEFAYPNGLLNLVTDESWKEYLYGNSRTTARFLRGHVHDNGGTVRAYDEDEITLILDRQNTSRFNGGNEANVILCHHSMRREHTRAVTDQRRFQPVLGKRGNAKQSFTAGDQMLPFHTDKDCPGGLLFPLDSGCFGKFVESPIHMPDDGERFVANKDSREIVLVESFNIACKAPAANGLIDDFDYSMTGLIPVA